MKKGVIVLLLYFALFGYLLLLADRMEKLQEKEENVVEIAMK